ncbi:MAG: hypothetical protein K2I00_00740, partial [Ruminococcus sp.]|nr:hypothetical protein [Ruminococcus sp.]
MKFFEQFDGNNILFLVWIASIILFFYDVEAKDFKFHRRKYKNMNMQYRSADMEYYRTQTNIPPNQVSNNEGENSNVQSGQTVSD